MMNALKVLLRVNKKVNSNYQKDHLTYAYRDDLDIESISIPQCALDLFEEEYQRNKKFPPIPSKSWQENMGLSDVFIVHYDKLVERKQYQLEHLPRVFGNYSGFWITSFPNSDIPKYEKCFAHATFEKRMDTPFGKSRLSIVMNHMYAYFLIYRTKAKQVLILEDDVKFNEKMMRENWREIINELSQVKFDIAFIGTCFDITGIAEEATNKFLYVKKVAKSRCGHGYLVSRSGAIKMLHTLPMKNNIDWQMNMLYRQYPQLAPQFYAVDPSPMTQGSMDGTLVAKNNYRGGSLTDPT